MSRTPSGSEITTPQAVESCHALLLWMIPAIDKLPRLRRFTLGERLETALLEVLECLVAASYQRDKTALLKTANNRLAVARHLWRLAHELGNLPDKRYQHGCRLLVELGAQVGGWLKSRQRASSQAEVSPQSSP